LEVRLLLLLLGGQPLLFVGHEEEGPAPTSPLSFIQRIGACRASFGKSAPIHYQEIRIRVQWRPGAAAI
jgi:hypothetical protein